VRLRMPRSVATLGVFPWRTARLEERRVARTTKQSSARAGIGFARTRLLDRAIAPVRASSRMKARLSLHARRVAEGGHLLSPVMDSVRPRFGWRFREITGEFLWRETVRHARALQARLHGNLQGEKVLLRNIKALILLNILPCKIFREKCVAEPHGQRRLR